MACLFTEKTAGEASGISGHKDTKCEREGWRHRFYCTFPSSRLRAELCGPMSIISALRKRGRLLPVLLAAGVVIIALLCVTAFFLPYLLKHYIERHSVEWVGRKITIDHIVLNPFTFTYSVDGVVCREPGSEEVFVSWESISVKSDLWAGFRDRHWRFRKVRIQGPYFHIVQKGSRFNFSDLLELGPEDAADTVASEPVFFSMEDIAISGARIVYESDLLKTPVGITGLKAYCTQITSESARMDFDLGFDLDQGGRLDGGFMIDTDRSLYAIRASLNSFELAPLLPYLQDLLHAAALEGQLDLRLDLEDSWADTTALAMSGQLRLDGLAVTDGANEPLIALGAGRVVLDTLNAKDALFKISRVSARGLAARIQQWPDGSNTWTKALKLDSNLAEDGTTGITGNPANVFVMLADYIRLLGQEFVANEYTADSLLLTDASVEFEDFTPEKPFRYKLDQVDIRSSRITTKEGTADFTASARLNQRGSLASTFRFDPKDLHNVEMDLRVNDLVLTDLDPYSRWYAAHPIQSGKLDYAGTTAIRNGRIDSKNHLEAFDLRFGKKTPVHDTGIYILPLRLGTSLLRDVHGKIDLDIPVTGDLNDPEFRPWPIVWKVLKNLVTKAVAAPVRLVGGLFGAGDEGDVEEVRFTHLSTAIGKEQKRPLDALALMLKEKPELDVALVSVIDVQEEAGEWAAKQAKMEYLGLQAPLSGADSLRVTNLSLRDSAFISYLDGKVPGTAGKHERERCRELVGAASANTAVQEMEQVRQQAVKAYLEKAGAPDGRITFRGGTAEELTGYTGMPGFRFIVDVQEEPDQGVSGQRGE